MIAVFGATGNTGRATVKELQALGEQPLCIVRNSDKAREVLGEDVHTALADITDRSAMEKALKGVKTVFVVTGHNPQADEQQINILEAAKAAGANYFVKVSGGKAIVGPNAESVVGRGHYAVEEAVKHSGLRWTILRPGLFMQNTFAQAASIKSDGKMIMPFPAKMPLAFIDVRDTGALSARVLRDPDKHAGKVYEFTGVLTNLDEFAQVFSQVLGKPVTFVAANLEQAEKGMRARNLPDWLVTHMLSISRAAEQGAFSTEATQPIRDIVGRAPLTTKQFVETFKSVFS
ncbi:MAG: NmrA family NAD(P)-binding protein [Gammaproteobacteria bacterium]